MKRKLAKDKSDEPKKGKPKISVRPTDSELEQLYERAASFGYKSLSKYLIERGLQHGTPIQSVDRERIERLLFEVRKIGMNIKQIARRTNMVGRAYSTEQLDRAAREVERVMCEIGVEIRK
jgi:hypothetical protein